MVSRENVNDIHDDVDDNESFQETNSENSPGGNFEIFKYAVLKSDGTWSPDMEGLMASDGSDISYAGTLGVGIIGLVISGVRKYRVCTQRGGWGPYISEYNKDNPAGNGTPIIAIEIVDPAIDVGVHIKGGSWLDKTSTVDFEGGAYAGCMIPIDGVWMTKGDIHA